MKPENKKHDSNPVWNKIRNRGFILLALALTLLSVRAQFTFWKELFGAETAIICSFVFEAIRLVSLYALLRSFRSKRLFGAALYLVIALFCASVSVTSWDSEIDQIYHEQIELKAKAYQEQIDQIKLKYADRMNQKIAKFDQDLYWVDSKMAADTTSRYWAIRKNQLIKTKNDLKSQMDAFLSETPNNPKEWIEKNAALLNLALDPIEFEKTRYNAILDAIRDIWHIDTAQKVQKFVALAFVIAIELGIIFFAVMAEIGQAGDPGVTESRSLVAALEAQFIQGHLRRFFSHYGEKIATRGVLPRSSVLNAKYRPLRKILASRGLNKKELQDLCNYYLYNHQQDHQSRR